MDCKKQINGQTPDSHARNHVPQFSMSANKGFKFANGELVIKVEKDEKV